MLTKTTHPRVPADVSAFLLTLAIGIRSLMLSRYGDGRDVGMGEALRLYLVHVGELQLPEEPSVLRRLDALRDVLMSTRAARAPQRPLEGPAHG